MTMITRVLIIIMKKAQDKGKSALRGDGLPRCVDAFTFRTTGIEIKNKNYQGQREGMSRNRKLQLGRNLRNLASHLSSRPVTEFTPSELVRCLPLAGQTFSPLTINSPRGNVLRRPYRSRVFSLTPSSVAPPCFICIFIDVPSSDSFLCI